MVGEETEENWRELHGDVSGDVSGSEADTESAPSDIPLPYMYLPAFKDILPEDVQVGCVLCS